MVPLHSTISNQYCLIGTLSSTSRFLLRSPQSLLPKNKIAYLSNNRFNSTASMAVSSKLFSPLHRFSNLTEDSRGAHPEIGSSESQHHRPEKKVYSYEKSEFHIPLKVFYGTMLTVIGSIGSMGFFLFGRIEKHKEATDKDAKETLGRFAALDGRFSGLEGRIGSLEGRVSVIETKLDAMKESNTKFEASMKKQEPLQSMKHLCQNIERKQT